MSSQATMSRDERSGYYMSLLGADYVHSHFGDATPLSIQQLTQNRYRRNPTTMVDHILDVIDLSGTERLLDVGCGNGFILRDVASRMRAGGSITAIDIAPGMLEAAKENVNFQWAPIEWIVGDARELGSLVDGVFDVVMANYIFHYIPDPLPLCKAFRAVTAASGKTIVTVEGLDSMHEMYQVHLDALRAVGASESLIDGLPHGRRGSLSTHNGAQLLRSAFGSVTEYPYTDALVFDNVAAFMEFYAAGHRYCGALPLLEGRVEADFFDRLAKEVSERVGRIISNDGVFLLQKENTVFACWPEDTK